MARSPSNRGITRRNTNLPPAARNTQDTTQAVRRMPDVPYGDQRFNGSAKAAITKEHYHKHCINQDKEGKCQILMYLTNTK